MDSKTNHRHLTTAHSSGETEAGADLQREAAVIASARRTLTQPGDYLVFTDGDQLRIVALAGDWTRIGRSTAADVRFDDSTVSRRHALITREPDGLKLLDDRSLNGVFVEGERVDRHPLNDGDSFVIGRYRLNFVSVTVAAVDTGALPPGSLRV
ncbi:MAG: FHA domain-containing protein [Actinobacteria bacterium]|uniref:Unannotated protein n=1 Tax=freshwater metagenome TaxID=449393 RepID=A0A6J5ZFC3_9ZZZZ|nr:FHA domain-containing protein [Actinomycetota bacterium]